MFAPLRLKQHGQALALFALVLFIVGACGSTVGFRSFSSYAQQTEESLVAISPLIVEGKLVAKGSGATPRRDDDPAGIPYDLYQLEITHVWSGPENLTRLMLAFQKSGAGVGVEGDTPVQAGQNYVFFLEAEPRKGGPWKGLRPAGGDPQLIWRAVGDKIVPTASHFREMTRAEFADLISAQGAKQQ